MQSRRFDNGPRVHYAGFKWDLVWNGTLQVHQDGYVPVSTAGCGAGLSTPSGYGTVEAVTAAFAGGTVSSGGGGTTSDPFANGDWFGMSVGSSGADPLAGVQGMLSAGKGGQTNWGEIDQKLAIRALDAVFSAEAESSLYDQAKNTIEWMWNAASTAPETLAKWTSTAVDWAVNEGLDHVSNLFYGFADLMSCGLTEKYRNATGWNFADTSSSMYTAGKVVGIVVDVGLGFANPCSAGAMAGAGVKLINGIQAVGNATNLVQNIQAGNWGSAALDAVGLYGNLSQLRRSCFAAGTPLLTPDGAKAIEEHRVGDLLVSVPATDPEGSIQARRVLGTIQRSEPILELCVEKQLIRTTGEHPFYVEGKGWTPAALLQPGDLLRSHDGQKKPVRSLRATGKEATVYNVRVEEYHTYFVGDPAWGFSVLAHNVQACVTPGSNDDAAPDRTKIGKFLEGDDVAEAGAHAKAVGKVTGVVDRAGAEARRAERMKGRPTVPGKDRDEFPPAAIKPDDPSKVSVKPIDPSHNRRSGRRLRDELPPDGTPVEIDP